MIELNLRAPEEFADTLLMIREAMDTARHPEAPDFFSWDRVYRPLFALHRRLEDHAILNGWTTALPPLDNPPPSP